LALGLLFLLLALGLSITLFLAFTTFLIVLARPFFGVEPNSGTGVLESGSSDFGSASSALVDFLITLKGRFVFFFGEDGSSITDSQLQSTIGVGATSSFWAALPTFSGPSVSWSCINLDKLDILLVP
jgi:hypothetical protein